MSRKALKDMLMSKWWTDNAKASHSGITAIRDRGRWALPWEWTEFHGSRTTMRNPFNLLRTPLTRNTWSWNSGVHGVAVTPTESGSTREACLDWTIWTEPSEWDAWPSRINEKLWKKLWKWNVVKQRGCSEAFYDFSKIKINIQKGVKHGMPLWYL